MNTEAAVYNILKYNSAVSGVCGTRIYANNAPQNTANACIVFQERDIEPSPTKSGASGLDVAWVAVDVYADTQREAKVLLQYVRNALDRYSGTVGGMYIQHINFEDATSLYDYESECYRANATFTIRQVI